MEKPKPGSISWVDLTVPNASEVKDFYAAVAGWRVMPIEMEGYDDFCMMPPDAGAPAAGISHASGPNADLPAQWLVYITVPDVEAALKVCREKGGQVIRDLKDMGGAKMAVIRDPAGAVAALYQPGKDQTCP